MTDYRLAVIPAAGRGARLDRPNTPKPLVDVGGKPLILNILGRLETAGIEKAIVLTGYEGKRVARELTNHPDLTLEVECIEAEANGNADWRRPVLRRESTCR